MAEDEPELSVGEKEALFDYLSKSQAVPLPDEKFNVHSFLHRVATADDTTKIGFLNEDEIGSPRHPIRTHKSIALIADKIMGNQMMADFFNAESEIITSTSLSRGGFLINKAVTQTKQIADVTKPKKENKGWFGNKKKDEKSEMVEK